jgi:CrcB protein
MRTTIAVGLAGFVGAIARYVIEGLISSRSSGFPWGTFVVNISGSFVLGIVFAAFVEGRLIASPLLRTAAMVGLIGAYTTFSTLSLETYRLLEDGSYGLAAANVLGSVTLGLGALFVGVVIGRSI